MFSGRKIPASISLGTRAAGHLRALKTLKDLQESPEGERADVAHSQPPEGLFRRYSRGKAALSPFEGPTPGGGGSQDSAQ